MQNSGLEWLHRTYQEPGRLAKRYLQDAAGLALHLPPQVALSVAQPRKRVQSAVQAYDIGSALVAVLSGDVHAQVLIQFEELMKRARAEHRHTILDLSRAAYLGPDTLGAMVRSATMAGRRGLRFWIAGLPGHLRRVLRSARLEHFFAISPSIADAAYRIEKAEQMLPSELAAVRSLSPEAREQVSIQLELLQELCERILSAAENPVFQIGGLRARASSSR
jgi:anti-anti-sigma factor